MINWSIQIVAHNGDTLLDTWVNPTWGSEGTDMTFSIDPGKWICTGQSKSVFLFKDGLHVATVPDSHTVTAGDPHRLSVFSVLAHRWHFPKTNRWEVQIEDKYGNILSLCEATLEVGKEGTEAGFSVQESTWTGTGAVSSIHVLKNGAVVASVPKNKVINHSVVAGSKFFSSYLIISSSYWHSTQPDTKRVVCDCGGWATYGREANIHEDSRFFVCSLRKAGA